MTVTLCCSNVEAESTNTCTDIFSKHCVLQKKKKKTKKKNKKQKQKQKQKKNNSNKNNNNKNNKKEKKKISDAQALDQVWRSALVASLFLVVRPGAPSSVLAPSSKARSP